MLFPVLFFRNEHFCQPGNEDFIGGAGDAAPIICREVFQPNQGVFVPPGRLNGFADGVFYRPGIRRTKLLGDGRIQLLGQPHARRPGKQGNAYAKLLIAVQMGLKIQGM